MYRMCVCAVANYPDHSCRKREPRERAPAVQVTLSNETILFITIVRICSK